MISRYFHAIYGIALTALFISCSTSAPESQVSAVVESGIDTFSAERIKGVSLEMPGNKIGFERFDGIKESNAEWIAMIPYGSTGVGEAKVSYSYGGDWWGESVLGTIKCIELAQKSGFKIMLKPHVWVVGQGWPGDFDLKTEAEWKVWEESYEEYILVYANVADSMNVDLFCIGTEYRKAVTKRGPFWDQLIPKIRDIYKGKITYAANWDNYDKVKFWDKLDYIGLDAYFPLSRKARPSMEELKKSWMPIQAKLADFSEKHNKEIIFTEYGYKSIEYANSGHWTYKEDSVKTSMENQVLAYKSLYETIWKEDYIAGGFLWKWHMYEASGGIENRRYTPQGKPSLEVIKEWYVR